MMVADRRANGWFYLRVGYENRKDGMEWWALAFGIPFYMFCNSLVSWLLFKGVEIWNISCFVLENKKGKPCGVIGLFLLFFNPVSFHPILDYQSYSYLFLSTDYSHRIVKTLLHPFILGSRVSGLFTYSSKASLKGISDNGIVFERLMNLKRRNAVRTRGISLLGREVLGSNR